jgi:hypothetical protein
MQEIEKHGKTIKVNDERDETQYQKSKRLRRQNRVAKHLGGTRFKKTRAERGHRGNTIVSIPIKDLTDEQFKDLQNRIDQYVPEKRRMNLGRNWEQKLTTLMDPGIAYELIAEKPDLAKIDLLCDPYKGIRNKKTENGDD